MTFGEKLQLLRKQKGMSQEQLASQLNVSRQAVSKWELNSSLPDTDNIIQLSKLFGVSTDYLLCNDSDNNDAKCSENCSTDKSDGSGQFNFLYNLIQKRGYIAGYVIAGYGVLALCIMRAANFSFKQILLPDGFDITLKDIPFTAKIPLYFTNTLSVIAAMTVTAGLVLAFYLKKKSKK